MSKSGLLLVGACATAHRHHACIAHIALYGIDTMCVSDCSGGGSSGFYNTPLVKISFLCGEIEYIWDARARPTRWATTATTTALDAYM